MGDSRSNFALGRLGLGRVLKEAVDEAVEAVDDLRRVVGDGGRRVRDVKSAVVPEMNVTDWFE